MFQPLDYNPPSDVGIKENIHPNEDWTRGLRKYKTSNHNPEWVYSYVVDENNRPFATVVYDRFPKGFVHLLVLPMTIRAEKPSHFSKYDLQDLKKIHKLAYDIADDLQARYDLPPFYVGYHALPSMADLHIHIVSGDLASQYMKRREHYTSFTNDAYFLTPEKVEFDIQKYGKVMIQPQSTLKNILRTAPLIHGDFHFKRFRELKRHLNQCAMY